jgi:hypothetical protein
MKLQVSHPCPSHGIIVYHLRTNTLLATAFFEAFREEIRHVGITKLSSLKVQEEIRRLTGRGAQSQDWPDFLQIDSALFRKN